MITFCGVGSLGSLVNFGVNFFHHLGTKTIVLIEYLHIVMIFATEQFVVAAIERVITQKLVAISALEEKAKTLSYPCNHWLAVHKILSINRILRLQPYRQNVKK